MNESSNVKNKRQKRQRPPRNLGRIACEILAGMATGFAAAVPVVYVIGASTPEGCFSGFIALGYMLFIVPPVYGLASAIGVYLVGNRGKQTGSLLLTFACGFIGGPVSLAYFLMCSSTSLIGVENVIWAPVFLFPSIFATLGFNLTRRYKEPPSS